MKTFEMDKSLLDNVLGLSCIENYLLYAFSLEKYDFRYLYAKNFVPFSGITKAFFQDGIQYAYFNKVPRVQRVAGENNLIELGYLSDLKESFSKFDFCCIKVTPEYVQEKYGREFWRDDHFILLSDTAQEGHRNYLNDNPRDIGLIRDDELTKIYGGETTCFNILRPIDKALQKKLLTDFKHDIAAPDDSQEFLITDIEKARDALGILKIIRKRIITYCGIYLDMDFAVPYLRELDKAYAVLEYMRLRNKTDFERINQVFRNLQSLDLDMLGILKNKMENVNE